MYTARKYYRKNLKSCGRMAIYGEVLKFTTEDVSINGTKVHMDMDLDIKEMTPVEVYLDDLKSKGQAIILWVKKHQQGGKMMGLKFTALDGVDDAKFTCY